MDVIVVDMVYSSFFLFVGTHFVQSKPQNQMCDGNQKCIGFVLKQSYIKLFYMTHTFDSEVSLRSWLICPTVCRAAAAPSAYTVL